MSDTGQQAGGRSEPGSTWRGSTTVLRGMGFMLVIDEHRAFDPAADLVYMHQRWCDPKTGTFAGSAPYPPMKVHRYGFAENSPAQAVDPDGGDLYILTYSRKESRLAHQMVAVDPCSVDSPSGDLIQAGLSSGGSAWNGRGVLSAGDALAPMGKVSMESVKERVGSGKCGPIKRGPTTSDQDLAIQCEAAGDTRLRGAPTIAGSCSDSARSHDYRVDNQLGPIALLAHAIDAWLQHHRHTRPAANVCWPSTKGKARHELPKGAIGLCATPSIG